MSKAQTLTRLSQLLIEMEMISEATTAHFTDAPRGISKPGSKPPRGQGESMLDEWLRIINALCEAGELNLEWHSHGKPNPTIDRVDRQRRILTAYEGRSAVFAAFVEGCSEDHVRRLRKQHNRRIEDGRERKVVDVPE